MEKKITIADIARMANVAKSTVSRYLNGGSVSEKTRRKIDTIVSDYNYQPNALAQNLKLKINHTVGVIVPRLDSTAQVEMLRGLDAANDEDTFLIVNTYQSVARELAAIEKLRNQHVSGLIILTANITDDIRDALKAFDVPVVIQGQDESDFHRVLMNDRQAGEIVGQYAMSLTPKKVLLLTIPEQQDWSIGHERFTGIYHALADYDVTTIHTKFNIDEARNDALRVMSENTFDLVIGATDRMTIGALQAGIATHQSAKYIGFGKSDLSTTVTPHLTSFEYDFYETGKLMYNLLKNVRENNPSEKQRLVFDGQLVERESTQNFY
ncbi:MAG: LacI family DNA-binding transcriptional regulator [Leuconostoc pseudomesenteroides]|uniref:LacI family DNA-binding transcriptional regulator n=1 Tax=Leuconostoc pseudomesenteroides TaxID=33968 RepID=UPI0039ED6BBD